MVSVGGQKSDKSYKGEIRERRVETEAVSRNGGRQKNQQRRKEGRKDSVRGRESKWKRENVGSTSKIPVLLQSTYTYRFNLISLHERTQYLRVGGLR